MMFDIRKFMRYIKSGYAFMQLKDRWRAKHFLAPNYHISSSEIKEKIAVYTCIFGNYDNIIEPIYIDTMIDYYILTDKRISKDSKWRQFDVLKFQEANFFTNRDKNRFFKMHPHLLFNDYKYSIYLDGNIMLKSNPGKYIAEMNLSNKHIAIHQHALRKCIYAEGRAVYALGVGDWKDIKQQLLQYKSEGFPKNYGLFDNCVMIREHNDDECIKLMEYWWRTYYNSKCKRDQLSFSYSLWKNQYTADDVLSLGNNAYLNPDFIVNEHKDRKEG